MYLRQVAIVAIAVASTACITFEEQTVSYRHDTARNMLLVHTIYTGIHGDGRPGSAPEAAQSGLTEAEQEELATAASGQQMFFFDNWVRVLDLDELRYQLASPAPPALTAADRAAAAAQRRLWNVLLQNVSISNGPFYLDKSGRLCAVQRMTVMNLDVALEAFNASWQPYARAQAADDPEWSRLAVSIHDSLAFDRNRLTIRYPGRIGSLESSLAGVVSATTEGGIVTLEVGAPLAGRVSFTAAVAPTTAANAIDFARAQIGIATAFDPRLDADRFLGPRAESAVRQTVSKFR